MSGFLVTGRTRFGDVLDTPCLRPFRDQLLLGPKGSPQNYLYNRLTLDQLGRITPAWSHAGLAEGLNFAIAQAGAGQMRNLPLYDSAALAADPTCAGAKLLFLPGRTGAPYVVIAPGGAYINVAITVEGLPIAAKLHEMGYAVFLLQYRCGRRGRLPKPFYDLQASLRYITAQANELGVDPSGYGVMGFSAGGHVAASIGTVNFGWRAAGLPKPAAVILGYPLVSLAERNLAVNCFIYTYMGRRWRTTLPPTYILEHMDREYPPTYLWQCRDDRLLSFRANGLAFARKAKALGVPCRFRPVERGGHGLGLAENSQAQGWLAEAVAFWQACRQAGVT